MKRFSIIPLVLITLLFTGCLNDNEDYEPEYLELGVVIGSTPSSFLISTDSKSILKPVEVVPQNITIEHGSRVLVRYSVVEKVEGMTFDFTVRILAMADILTKPILHVNSELIRDSVKNDPVQIINVWIAQDFLNVEFNYSGSGQKTHYFYTSIDPERQVAGGVPIIIDFHHNAKDDINYRTYRSVMSIPLVELQDENATKVNLRFISRDQYATPYTKDLEYKYVEDEE